MITEVGLFGGADGLSNQANTQSTIEDVMTGFMLSECLITQALLSQCAVRLIRWSDIEDKGETISYSLLLATLAAAWLKFYDWSGLKEAVSVRYASRICNTPRIAGNRDRSL